MRKYSRLFVLAALMACLMAGSAFAGTMTLSVNAAGVAGPYLAASEVIGAGVGAGTVVGIGDKIVGYTPSDFAGAGVANDPSASIKVTGATGAVLTVVGVTPAICDVIGGTPIAIYSTGSTTDTLVFQANAGQNLVNGTTYVLGKNGCANALAAVDITVTVPNTASSLTVTLTTNNAAITAKDIATTTLLTVGTEYTATLVEGMDAKIDPQTGFTKLIGGTSATSDEIQVQVVKAAMNLSTVLGADTNKVTITVSDMTGITGATVDNAFTTPCVLDTNAKTITCTKTANIDLNLTTITVNIAGNVALGEKTFTATQEITFASGAVAHTLANGKPLLENVSAGAWLYNGTTFTIPYIKSQPGKGFETTIKLQSSDKTPGANGVSVVVLCSDGSVLPLALGSITPGTPMTITGSQLVTAVKAHGKNVFNGNGFAADITVYTNDSNVYCAAMSCDPLGCRNMPCKTHYNIDGTAIANPLKSE